MAFFELRRARGGGRAAASTTPAPASSQAAPAAQSAPATSSIDLRMLLALGLLGGTAWWVFTYDPTKSDRIQDPKPGRSKGVAPAPQKGVARTKKPRSTFDDLSLESYVSEEEEESDDGDSDEGSYGEDEGGGEYEDG